MRFVPESQTGVEVDIVEVSAGCGVEVEESLAEYLRFASLLAIDKLHVFATEPQLHAG